MTIALNLVTVAGSIAELNIPGVTVRNIDQIPESALPLLPILFPVPNGFVTEIEFVPVTMGANAAAMNLSYTLNYRYLHAVVGSGGGLLSVYTGLIVNLVAILTEIMGNGSPDGAVEMKLQSVSDIGALSDPAGQTMFHGVNISLRVLEFIQ